MRGLTRSEVDRAHAIALKLGGWSPVSGLELCEDIRRLHDVMASALHALTIGHPSGAVALLRAECDPAWAAPFPETNHPGSIDPGWDEGPEEWDGSESEDESESVEVASEGSGESQERLEE